jgi:hypothetical protein
MNERYYPSIRWREGGKQRKTSVRLAGVSGRDSKRRPPEDECTVLPLR